MTEQEKLTTIAENMPKVFENGKRDGRREEYDAFWDIYQDHGNAVSYQNAFAGRGWTNDIFKPKYNLNPTSAYMMFRVSNISGDLTKILSDLGLSLDFSKSDNLQYTFYMSKFTKIGLVDFTGVTSTPTSTFGNSKSLESVEIKVDENTIFSSMLNGCENLQRLIVHGVIGQNGFNVSWSTLLSHDSLMSIINALQDKTGDTSGTSWIVTLGTTNLAKLSDAEKAIATEKGWSLI